MNLKKMDYTNLLKTLFLIGLNFGLLRSQTLFYGCPTGWELLDKKCYLFVSDTPRVYEEADSACWLYGANLVSINTFQEHTFVRSWLNINDARGERAWFTGGVFRENILVWSSENVMFNGQHYWIRQPSDNENFTHIGYTLGGIGYDGYGWSLVSGSIPSNYICELDQSEATAIGLEDRGFDYGLGIVDPDDIDIGPKIIEEPQSIVVVGETSSIFVECTASGNPNPIYTWWRTSPDNIITSATNPRYTFSGGRLTIQDPIEQEDSNDYGCSVENDQGKILSTTAHILFGYLHNFSPVKPDDQFATAFEGTKLDCQPPSAQPVARYEWFKFTPNVFILPGHPYQFVSNSGLLYFSEVQPTDSKKYYCVATLVASENYVLANSQPPSRTSLGTWLIISSGKNDGDYGPIIYTHTFPSPALRGRTIRLECIAYGTLPLYYHWRREDGQPFPKGTTTSDLDRVLTIPNAQLNAEGTYTCICTRTGGVASKHISVVMESKPYFPFPIKNQLVDDGQRVKWLCKAVARPAATYTWYKDGKPIKYTPGQIEIRGRFLLILSVQKERDQGMYQCGATNQHGTTYSTGQLRVLDFPPNFLRYPLPDQTLAPLNGNITIPCRVEAAPVPTVTWLKNGGNLNVIAGETSNRIGMSLNNDLVIKEVQYSDQGDYRCEATNTHGTTSDNTLLQVVEGIQIVQPPTATTVRVNTTAFMYCQASYNLRYDLTYLWMFNGYLIDYELSKHFVTGRRSGVEGLYITNAQYTHRGLYQCIAKTTLHSMTRSAYLRVEGPPGAPAGVYIDDLSVTSYSVRLIWTVGVEIDHGDPIISFDIEGESHFHPDEWKILAMDIPAHLTTNEAQDLGLRADQRSIGVNGLIPNTGYRFRVRAVNNFGRGQEASVPSTTVKIPSTAPVVSPRNVGGGGGKVGTLRITWDPLDIAEHCGPNIGYIVFWKELGEQRRDWLKHRVTGNVGTYSHTVGADNYYLEYEVKVAAFNDFGDGPNSTVQIIFSAEGLPIGVPTLHDSDQINSTAVVINWDPVPDNRENMKGRVKGYTIQYFADENDEFNPLDSRDPDFIMTKEVYGQQDHAIIIGLEANLNHFARVQVFNTAGRGPKGEWRLAETLHLAPRLYPRHVKVTPHTEHSVIVHWRGISTSADEESLLGYKLRVWKVQEDIRTAEDTVVDKVMSAELGGLQSRTVYVLRVLGYSTGGDGALSEPVYFTVLGGNVPFDPSTSQICYDQGDLGECGSASSFSASLWTLISLLVLHTFWRNQL